MTLVPLRAPSARWLWIASAWCAFAFFNASQTLLTMKAIGEGRSLLKPFLVVFISWLPWALATPLVISLARRWSVSGRRKAAALTAHLMAFMLISATAETWSAVLRVAYNPWRRERPAKFLDTLSDLFAEQLVTFLVVYAVIVTVTYVVDSRQRAARLNEQLSQAQLAALRGQMDPHFIFNTLNSIASLVTDQRGEAAIAMIVGLSEFLRRASEDSHRAQVTLREEVDYLQRYVEIQKARFGDQLRVSVEIPEDLLQMEVPSLLLQPLVENAIKHGVSRRRSGGEIRVAAKADERKLRLVVFNDGPQGLQDLASSPHRVGLGNLRTRLQILYGSRADLLLRPAEAGGVEVVVILPLEEA